ncbi:haloalkane dehalogenase [Actinoallomurus iriomotensis]|uniref:Haloalkane dehalogenase n=1 Tax=Actinoallomurus iriomotensis TaxID=478107 RepID=A0A9W6SF82_9ACTN|nr:haloalkane dehalogenase [Actinoallomurus iriomotensis]GLY91137.1 haloalkane dehalogenase [Actinoallomurus iriomotensis]
MPIQRVLDSTIFYRETGDGAPVVFLHGNPTSSHLWRDVIPAVPGRRLAPDLIGMGESGKPAIGYSFADHARYLDAWFDALALDEVILVGHDWGGALAFDWAARHPERVRGIAVTETIVKPMAWEEFPEAGRALFEAIKSDRGEVMMLDDNAFIEMLPGSVASPLAEDDIAAYRAPYPTRESRLPLLRWARSMPLGGEPADVVARVEAYDAWLAASPDVPKLLITFAPGPGAMMTPEMIDWCERHLAGLEIERYDAVAGHHTPEDRPDLIAAAVVSWRGRHRI